MKIQDAGQKAQIIQYVNQHAKAAEKNQTAAGSGASFSPMDRVELSSSSRLIQKIQEAAQAAPDIRAEKVAELKKKIADGTYQVSSADIAGKMLKDILIELNK
ncbi:MAG: flagellar biosynthesis anti-sigma factor FlgM [Desulfobacterota bacterium]|jgi:negative regulator of flagellin synthesis FlgM|nr:flagellar biosynthesis anti-sigma factor FlgM [Thermodesulfobacteriota bacterium]